MTQEQTIIKHLQEHSYITPKTSYQVYGIYRLSAVIHRLRRNYTIISEDMRGRNKFGEKVNYTRYSLPKEPSFKHEG